MTMSDDGSSYNKTLGRLRLIALFAVIVGLVWIARPVTWLVLVGAAVAAVGEWVRWWAAGHLLKTKELVISGPYRYTRNPLYLGRFLILTGLCIAAGLPYGSNWVLLVVGWVVFFGYYLRRKERVEPARLREHHGEAYDRYFEAVPALFPTFRPYAATSDLRWTWERLLRNREQWMVIGLTIAFAYLYWRSTTG